MMNLPLPLETRQYFGKDKNKLKSCNLGLLFSKYFYCWSADWRVKEEQNKEFREDIVKISLRKEDDFIAALNVRQTKVAECLQSSNWRIESFNAATDSRLIIGLGSESVIETGLTLHPLYGFPYLPASGLKGLARAYAEIVDNASGDKLLAIFGSESKGATNAANNQQGKVFFMDGLPIKFPELDLDIMNPHYGDYYQGNTPPADYLKPNPVTFLAVAPEQRFSFSIYSREAELLNKAKAWLIGGLTELGAGGKTNVGYGYFRMPETPISSGQEVQAQNTEEGDSLMARFADLRTAPNPERFVEFAKSIKPEEIASLENIGFSGMESAVNIGLVPTLEETEVSPEVLKIIAEKMLEVITPKKKWDDKKKVKYRKLLSMAGRR